jgi:hypothetical protein
MYPNRAIGRARQMSTRPSTMRLYALEKGALEMNRQALHAWRLDEHSTPAGLGDILLRDIEACRELASKAGIARH